MVNHKLTQIYCKVYQDILKYIPVGLKWYILIRIVYFKKIVNN